MRKNLLILLLLGFGTHVWAQQFTQTISFLGTGEDSRLKGFGSELSMYGDYLVASAPEYINDNICVNALFNISKYSSRESIS